MTAGLHVSEYDPAPRLVTDRSTCVLGTVPYSKEAFYPVWVPTHSFPALDLYKHLPTDPFLLSKNVNLSRLLEFWKKSSNLGGWVFLLPTFGNTFPSVWSQIPTPAPSFMVGASEGILVKDGGVGDAGTKARREVIILFGEISPGSTSVS